MRKFLTFVGIMVIALSALGVTTALAAHPQQDQTCEENEGGTCYDFVDPLYTDGSYTCPTGSTAIEGDPEHCLVDTSGYVYATRQVIDATYKCTDGYTEVQGGEKACAKVLVAGHYEVADQPSTLLCPDPVTWSYFYAKDGITYSATIMYNKPESDPHHCHREAGNVLPVPIEDWPGFVRGRLNQDNPENANGETVYQDCSTLGTGWQLDPAAEHQCRKWINSTYTWADKVVDVASHYGDCLNGYTPVDGSDTQCQKWVEGNSTIEATYVSGTPYCTEGTLVDGKCKVEVPCPPDPDTCPPPVPPSNDGGRSCAEYKAYLTEVNHLERYENLKRCLPANGVGDWLANFIASLFD